MKDVETPLYKYRVIFAEGADTPAFIYAESDEEADWILRANFGPNPRAKAERLRPATPAEKDAMKKRRGSRPRRRDV